MVKNTIIHGALFCLLTTVSFAQPVTTLSNAELFSRQYAQADTIEINFGTEGIIKENASPSQQYNVPKEVVSSTMYVTVGIIAGFGLGAMVGLICSDPSGTQSSSGDMASGLASLNGAIIGAGVGAIVGLVYYNHVKNGQDSLKTR